jgi:hypothetical protein
MTDDELQELGDVLIFDTADVLRKAGQPCTAETVMKYLTMAVYRDADWRELIERGTEIYDRAKELLGD